MPNFKNISALCSVFKETDTKEFESSLNSIINQSLPPKEIIIIIDGIISENLYETIIRYCESYRIKFFRLDQNKGLGNALSFGLRKCNYKIVARFDTDDISLKERFKKQLNFINNGWDLVSSAVVECNKEKKNKKKPTYHLKTFSKVNKEITEDDLILRNPINHPSVMFNMQKMILFNKTYNQKMRKHQDFLLWRELKLDKKVNFKILHISDITLIMNSKNLIKKRSSLKSFSYELLLFYYSFLIKKRFDIYIKLAICFLIRILGIYISLFLYKFIRTRFLIHKVINIEPIEEINSILKNM
jgi:glycosyltransferase involved in cell wall biosynthesis